MGCVTKEKKGGKGGKTGIKGRVGQDKYRICQKVKKWSKKRTGRGYMQRGGKSRGGRVPWPLLGGGGGKNPRGRKGISRDDWVFGPLVAVQKGKPGLRGLQIHVRGRLKSRQRRTPPIIKLVNALRSLREKRPGKRNVLGNRKRSTGPSKLPSLGTPAKLEGSSSGKGGKRGVPIKKQAVWPATERPKK